MKIEKVVEFECAMHQNAINVAVALAQAGRLVKIRTDSSRYIVEVYEPK